MKKKLFAVSMILILALSIVGCGSKDSGDSKSDEKQTPYEFYQEVSENSKNIKDAAFTGTTSVKMGESDAMNMNFNAKLVQRSETDADLEMKFDMNGMGMEQEGYTAYFTDGYLYSNASGQKIKTQMDVEDALKMANNTQLDDFDEAIFKNAVLTTEGEDTTIEFTVTKEQTDEIMKQAMSASGASSASDSAAMLSQLSEMVKLGDMKIKMTADKDNMPKYMEMRIPMTIESDESSESDGETGMNMDCVVTMEYQSINTGLTIDFPDDLDQYQEATV